ncbi:XdhC family protein [Galbibacter sp. BG1]|uniref:XdhC family protein n=1 Tax=Galbibacter sp. BG1 TaxID=1170699 RepID=UPI0015BFD959|nr:XdhC/CoxI family protein [Galbibacter sp. BG1]QLE00771.1 XdhC family protein [Galbibacter sp. BG1]
MTHEFKKIIESCVKAKTKNLKSVLATVVALEGSSYRRPGVRMLIREDGKMTGAVSGGCVEKEILRQSTSVFKTGIPKIMTYDGRYRLGCEGILYILLEPFMVDQNFVNLFNDVLLNRQHFSIISYFRKNAGADKGFGSVLQLANGTTSSFSGKDKTNVFTEELEKFSQNLKPYLKLIVIGAEHDSVQLAALASLNGWEVVIVAPEDDARSLANFPGATKIENTTPANFNYKTIDRETAVLLMTHSFNKDLQFLIQMRNLDLRYLGILGPVRRREQLFQKIIEEFPETDPLFFENIHAPAGINIGAETPQEIAVSVIAEILAVFREQDVFMLKERRGKIHSDN